METVVLEQTLSKIGALLALGFGEAGSKIIAHNIKGQNEMDPMLPGVKSMFIFGFCDIRNFTDISEVLEEEVMLFVNTIGDIVHNTVNQYSGFANKNIGDAFLIVWKFEKEDQEYDLDRDVLELIPSNRVSQLADMSVISFLLILAQLKKSRDLQAYNNHKGLNSRLPDFKVSLGMGLHLGYAIEGAIGSYYKIDASYLS